MGKYQNIAKQLREKTSNHKKSLNNDIFSCYYCPAEGHSLCGHQTRCILNEQVADILLKIKKNLLLTYKLREKDESTENQENINRLILERKKLFAEYYKMETKSGGF